jgi:hypothetical protein
MSEFFEIQRFVNYWNAIAILPILGVSSWGFFKTSDPTLFTLSIFGIIISGILLTMRMTTIINEEYLLIKFFPFFLRRKIFWSEVKRVEVIRYGGLYEFGGFNSPGIRFGRNGLVAYRIRGDMGILVETNELKRIIIGTRLPASVTKSLSGLLRRRT